MGEIESIESAAKAISLLVALAVEIVMVCVIAVGTVRAMMSLGRTLSQGKGLGPAVRDIWLHYAAWILLALELALAADLIETVVAPSWSDIGQLAAIAAVRTVLGWFLGRDIAEFRETRSVPPA